MSSKLLKLAAAVDAAGEALFADLNAPRRETVRDNLFVGVFSAPAATDEPLRDTIPSPPPVPQFRRFPRWL